MPTLTQHAETRAARGFGFGTRYLVAAILVITTAAAVLLFYYGRFMTLGNLYLSMQRDYHAKPVDTDRFEALFTNPFSGVTFPLIIPARFGDAETPGHRPGTCTIERPSFTTAQVTCAEAAATPASLPAAP